MVTVGFDGSKSRDATGIVIVRASDGLTVNGGLWEKPERTASFDLPRKKIIKRVDEIFATYRVVRFYGDPRYWETDIDAWAEKHGDKAVLEIPDSDVRRMKAASRWEALIEASLQQLKADEPPGSLVSLCHDGDPDLRRHLGNATRLRLGGRAGKAGGWRPGKKAEDRNIDLVDAALLAHEARGDALAKGELENIDYDVLASVR